MIIPEDVNTFTSHSSWPEISIYYNYVVYKQYNGFIKWQFHLHVSRRICSRTFSVRLRLFRLFSALLLCSFLLFCPSPSPSYCTRVRIMFPSIPSHPFSFPHKDPTHFQWVPTSLSYYFCYCLAITPISPTPSHPASLLSSVLYCLMIRSFLLFWYV